MILRFDKCPNKDPGALPGLIYFLHVEGGG